MVGHLTFNVTNPQTSPELAVANGYTLSTHNVQRRFKESQWTVVMIHILSSQINSFRNSNVFICFLKFCTVSAALMLSGSSFLRRGA